MLHYFAYSIQNTYRGTDIPDPIKLVRRLTALEMSLGHLKHDCDDITIHRKNLMGLVLEKQNRNLSQVEKVWETAVNTNNSIAVKTYGFRIF
jgi:hypothetical protein